MSFPFQSIFWYVFGAINTWSRLPIFEVPPDSLNSPIFNSNAILFERLSFAYPQNLTNSVSAFQRQKNLGRLSVCAFVNQYSMTNFEWIFEDNYGTEVGKVFTENCAIEWKASKEGVYKVNLIVRQKRSIIMQFQQTIRFVDYWIVSIGDSFSSGEINSARNMTKWPFSEKCHRSTQSWPYKIYEKILNFARNKFAVHFTYLSCSGASIDGGILPILSQLNTVESIRKVNDGKGPELLMLTAGGNDVGFSAIINQLLHKRSLSASKINFRLLFVSHQLDRLARRIQDEIQPSQTIIPTYFQFANNDEGELDNKCADLMHMSKNGIRYAQNNILRRLNELIQLKSKENGWTAVPEVTRIFDRAGLCAKNPLINSNLHPTEEAHRLIADLIFTKLNFRDFISN